MCAEPFESGVGVTAVPVADIVYRGTAEVGGSIGGVMNLSDGLQGALRVDAILAEGGSYEGRAVLR